MNERNTERLQSAIVAVIVIAFSIVVIGTMFIPALLAYLYGWYWIICYPVLLVFLIAVLPRKKS